MQHYISDSIYGLTLAWITSENSTKQLEYRHLDSIFFAGPYLLCYCVWSRPHLSVPVANCSSAPFSNQLSSRVPLPLPATPRFQVQKPFVWFRAKADKGIVCMAGHLYSVTSLCLPVTIRSRVLVREFWKRGLNWDEEESLQSFSHFAEDLSKLSDMHFGRQSRDGNRSGELYLFCDASKEAYGFAAYYVQDKKSALIFAQLHRRRI